MANGQVTTGLAELAPGPELAAALDGIDLSTVSNGEIIAVLQARSRQRAHNDARFLAVVAEVGRRDPCARLDEVGQLGEPTRYGADETRLALAWTRRAAEAEHDFAENPDGTAVITADGLPPDEAAAACERIDRLARAAKRAGHPGKLDQIRADVFLGLLNGRFDNLDRDQIITHLLHSDTDTDGAAAPTGVEVRVELATLLDLNDHPGEIPGWGPLHAHLTRQLVARQRRAEWRFAITNHTGHLICGGITRHRPAGIQGGADGGVVELHIPATLLAKLAANPPPGWAAVISDLARQYAAWPETKQHLDQRPGRRLPTVGLRRHTQIRDRTCRGPGCRLSTTKTEYDYTHDYRYGGPTIQINGGNVCNHDHDLKTKGGWRLEQPEPGTFTWHTPLGQTHTTQGEPVITPLPEPDDDLPPF